MRNLHLSFDCMYCSQKVGEDFAKFCGLLRIHELYCAACTFENEGLSVFDQMFDSTIVYQISFKIFAVSFDIENHTSNR